VDQGPRPQCRGRYRGAHRAGPWVCVEDSLAGQDGLTM
jgi:hypothetical protein